MNLQLPCKGNVRSGDSATITRPTVRHVCFFKYIKCVLPLGDTNARSERSHYDSRKIVPISQVLGSEMSE